MGYVIGSWNLRTFTGNEEKRDIDLIANVIDKEGFHIMALQEVMDTKNISGSQTIDALKARLPNWDGCYGNPNKMGFYAADYGFGFLWNSIFIEKCPDDICALSGYEMFGSGGMVSREPLYMKFIPVNGPDIEIRLINVHIEYGKGRKHERIKEFRHITGVIYDDINSHRGVKARDTYTVVLGDYNLSALVCNKHGNAGMNTKVNKPTIISNKFPWFSLSDYDHFTIKTNDFDGNEVDVKSKRVNSVRKYLRNDFKKHRRRLSDHVPIKLELNIKREE